MKYYICLIAMCFYNLTAYAVTASEKQAIARKLLGAHRQATADTAGIGAVAGNLFNFGKGLIQTIKTLSIFSGVVLLIFSIQLYFKHRNNPTETPVSMVFLTFFISLGLIILPFIPVKF